MAPQNRPEATETAEQPEHDRGQPGTGEGRMRDVCRHCGFPIRRARDPRDGHLMAWRHSMTRLMYCNGSSTVIAEPTPTHPGHTEPTTERAQ